MLSVVGIGHSFPETSITNDLLKEWGALNAFEVSGGVRVRHSVLPLKYLEATKNSNPRKLYDSKAIVENYGVIETATDLAVRASKLALERAGIPLSEVGLLLADTLTPEETCPSEAHRIAGKLGIKIPCYDTVAGYAALGLFAEMLCTWKEERIPSVTLVVSSNTPSRRINYAAGDARLRFGDAAGAVVIIKGKSGDLQLLGGRYEYENSLSGSITIPLFDSMSSLFPPEMLRAAAAAQLRNAIQHERLSLAESGFVGPQISPAVLQEMVHAHGIDTTRHLSNVALRGDSLGSASITVLSEHWESVRGQSRLLCIQAGAGGTSGYALFGAA